MRVVTQQIPAARSFNIGFFVDVGSRDESLEQHGCSHVLEHVLFKGTKSRTAQQISAAFDGIGGDVNAWTARDHTAFHARVLAQDAEVAVDVLGDMLTGSLIAADDFAAEIAVILDEIAMHDDDPSGVSHDMAMERLFAPDPFSRRIIGTQESITSLTPERVQDFWRTFYAPDSIVVAATGDVDHDWLCAKLKGLSWPGAESVDRPRTINAEPQPGLHADWSSMSQTTATLAWRGCSLEDERRHAASVLATILGGGMSSRLQQRIREVRGLAYSVDASEAAHQNAGVFTIEWQALPGRTIEILTEVQAIVEDVMAGGVTQAEVDAALAQIRGQTLLHFERHFAVMTHLGVGWLQDDLRTPDEIIADFEKVTLEQVTEVARTMLSPTPVLELTGARCGRKKLERLIATW